MEKSGINLLQDILYRANMNDLSVYENGDRPIAKLPKRYVKDGRISISDKQLLLVEDSPKGHRFGRTCQSVFEILRNWCVLDKMNLTPKEARDLVLWFELKGVIIDNEFKEYANIGLGMMEIKTKFGILYFEEKEYEDFYGTLYDSDGKFLDNIYSKSALDEIAKLEYLDDIFDIVGCGTYGSSLEDLVISLNEIYEQEKRIYGIDYEPFVVADLYNNEYVNRIGNYYTFLLK